MSCAGGCGSSNAPLELGGKHYCENCRMLFHRRSLCAGNPGSDNYWWEMSDCEDFIEVRTIHRNNERVVGVTGFVKEHVMSCNIEAMNSHNIFSVWLECDAYHEGRK